MSATQPPSDAISPSGVGSNRANATLNVRCEGITAGGSQCKCWATQRINDIPYCETHSNKELNLLNEHRKFVTAVAMQKPARKVGP